MDIGARCRGIVDESRVPQHEFHNLVVREGTQAKLALEYWAAHDYYVSRSFPSLVALLISETEDDDLRSVLVRNLWDECGHGHPELAHFKNYEKLLASIDVSPATTPCEPVLRFVDLQRDLARRDPITAAAVFCYANEYLCLLEFNSIERGLQNFFPTVDLQYIMQIDTVDDRHQRELQDVLARVCSPSHMESIGPALTEVLEVRAQLYDLALTQG